MGVEQPPGWYPDPSGEPGLRYWDGAWTGRRWLIAPFEECPPSGARRGSTRAGACLNGATVGFVGFVLPQ